jgi:hypothetical protein
VLLQFGFKYGFLVQQKQASVALSSIEVEYMAANSASCEAIWLRKLLAELTDQTLDTIVIYCDNQSCIKLFENQVFHDWSKHIEIRYHFIRDRVEREQWFFSTFL